jgi:hypothetical protein
MTDHHCRICGLYLDPAPWGDDGRCPSYEYCPCCNVEFGNQDYTPISARRYREKWMTYGARWFEPGEKPKNWDLNEQLKNIPKEFR